MATGGVDLRSRSLAELTRAVLGHALTMDTLIEIFDAEVPSPAAAERSWAAPGPATGVVDPTCSLELGAAEEAGTDVGEPLLELEIRELLRRFAPAEAVGEVAGLVEEFWVPAIHARADLVTVGSELHAYEIKSHADTLKRLPTQVVGFSALFDRCSVVVAPRHLEKAREIVPAWWGIIVAGPGRVVTELRPSGPSPDVDIERQPHPEACHGEVARDRGALPGGV